MFRTEFTEGGQEDLRGKASKQTCDYLGNLLRLLQGLEAECPRRRLGQRDLFRKRDSSPCRYLHRAGWPTHSSRKCNRSNRFRKLF